MRPDRLLTLWLARPWRRVFKVEGKRLPVLMYHSISAAAEEGRSDYYKVRTSPERFEEQMAHLAADGWTGVTLSKGLQTLNAKASTSCSRKIFAITFDDGFRDFLTAATPTLLRYGFRATMYLPTGYIGKERKTFKGNDCLTWTEVAELQCAGMEFGSHTVNHPTLVELPWQEIERELSDSKSQIEQSLGSATSLFAYPYAFPERNLAFVSRFRDLLAQAGYDNCVTTCIGRADAQSDVYALPRLPANSADDPRLLRSKLDGDYDWMRFPQRLRKRSVRHFHHRPEPSSISAVS